MPKPRLIRHLKDRQLAIANGEMTITHESLTPRPAPRMNGRLWAETTDLILGTVWASTDGFRIARTVADAAAGHREEFWIFAKGNLIPIGSRFSLDDAKTAVDGLTA